ncbi:hypothetical protein DF268_01015 [Streptomyces sp. V2]|uniref:hypothetical protein n=1 Tax=Streptomyces sp. V2 TaxID=1424099 RepID=UPI000D66E833|nr:hypothetical protein [Streptomyces sp. V2]PWG15420.1 hypothetical protein DF268_01015 [Streptomyces sp. V2]
MEPTEIAASAEEYAFLWNGTEEGWAIIETQIGPAVYNTRTSHALLIEDNDVHTHVIQLMREHGCPSLDSIP